MTKDTDTLEKTARPPSKTGKILSAFERYEDGLTTYEVQIYCGYTEKHGAWKRISELAKAGRIVPRMNDDGTLMTRPSSMGKEQQVHMIPRKRMQA